jgi:hypothetical protein
MLILRIRHAETALADGRLDEVFELVRDPKLRSHRRGQDLITRLVNALEKRGREHLTGSRFTAALTDCEKAQQLAGDLPQLLALRNEAMDAMTEDRRNQRLKATAVAAARNEIDNGRLAAGERLLAVASVNDTRAGALLQELGARHNLVDSAVHNADEALGRDDIDAALAELERARGTDRSDRRIKDLTDRVRKALREEISQAIEEGRLDRANSLGERLSRVDEQSVESKELLARSPSVEPPGSESTAAASTRPKKRAGVCRRSFPRPSGSARPASTWRRRTSRSKRCGRDRWGCSRWMDHQLIVICQRELRQMLSVTRASRPCERLPSCITLRTAETAVSQSRLLVFRRSS